MQDLPVEKKKEVIEQYGTAENWARQLLMSGAAHAKMKEIIAAQKGDPDVKSTDLKGGKFAWDYTAHKSGTIRQVNNHNISLVAKLLGAPNYKRAGMDVFVRRGQKVKKGDKLALFYGETSKRIKEAIYSLELFPIFEIK
jgi:AMP phosphorylase